MRAIIIFLILFPLTGASQVISTIIGNGTQGYNGDGIAATAAQLNYPHNIAVDAYGNIYFSDYGNVRIRKVTISTGIISTIAGTGTNGYNGDGIAATAAQISQPTSLAFDSNGDLYFTDRNNHRVRKITMSTGIISTVAGTGTGGYNGDGIAATTAQLSGPNEVAFDASGNMYIADWNNQRVRKVDKATNLISTITGTGVGGYNGDGIAATASQIDGPCGITFDNAGNIYIAAYSGQRIRKITVSTGLISTIAGTGTAGYNGDGIAATAAQLNWPAYISFDKLGNLYIGDDNNFRIRKIDQSTGLISTIAGTGTGGYNGDGTAPTVAQVNHAYFPYFDNNNCQLYIVDTYNHRIRKVTGGFTGCSPAVAPGNKATCQVLPAVTIDNSNNNIWVPVYDTAGRIAAEINANGNNLGVVNTSLFTKTGPCREDASNRLYLNRNITITPQNQPSSGTVSLRLYILKAEFDSLKNAQNSLSMPSGVPTINEVDVFKNTDNCFAVGAATALPLTATPGTYNSDYYLQVNVSSFSSFYFANKLLTAILPVKLKSFTGKRSGSANELKWEANCNTKVMFNIERSADGIYFNKLGNITADQLDCTKPFYFTDNSPLHGKNYYRLQIVDASGAISYSFIIALHSGKVEPIQISLQENPVKGSSVNINIDAEANAKLTLLITDVTGRMLLNKPLTISAGNNHLAINTTSLANGIYWIYGTGNNGRTNVVKFIKQ